MPESHVYRSKHLIVAQYAAMTSMWYWDGSDTIFVTVIYKRGDINVRRFPYKYYSKEFK